MTIFLPRKKSFFKQSCFIIYHSNSVYVLLHNIRVQIKFLYNKFTCAIHQTSWIYLATSKFIYRPHANQNNKNLWRVESFCWGFTRRPVVFLSKPIFFRLWNPDQASGKWVTRWTGCDFRCALYKGRRKKKYSWRLLFVCALEVIRCLGNNTVGVQLPFIVLVWFLMLLGLCPE